jgi:protein CpxP
MKRIHKHLLVAGLLAALGFAANAQAPAGPGPGMAPAAPMMHGGPMGRIDPAHMRERMEQRMAERHAKLKTLLQITPAQEGAWNAFTAAMKPPANWKRPDPAEFERLTTPERIDRMRARRAERIAEMDRRAEATKTFYAALTPEQKKAFDVLTARHLGGPRGHFGGPGHYGS